MLQVVTERSLHNKGIDRETEQLPIQACPLPSFITYPYTHTHTPFVTNCTFGVWPVKHSLWSTPHNYMQTHRTTQQS